VTLKAFDRALMLALDKGDFGAQDLHHQTFKHSYSIFLKEVLSENDPKTRS